MGIQLDDQHLVLINLGPMLGLPFFPTSIQQYKGQFSHVIATGVVMRIRGCGLGTRLEIICPLKFISFLLPMWYAYHVLS